MLSGIADKQHSIFRPDAREKLVEIFRASE